MAKQRYIDTKFWDDPFVVNLDPSEKLLFLYLLTNPLTNIAGIYEITMKRISNDTGYNQDVIKNIFARFEKDKKIYYITNYIIIVNFPKHQEYEKSPKIKTGIEAYLNKLPPELLQSIQTLNIPYTYPLNTLNIPYANPLNYINTNININNNVNVNNNVNTNLEKEIEEATEIQEVFFLVINRYCTPFESNALKKLLETYGMEKVKNAIIIAKNQNKVGIAYIQAVCEDRKQSIKKSKTDLIWEQAGNE